MDDKILDLANKIETSSKKHRNWKKIVLALAIIVVFCTTYILILPATTMEKNTICGKVEHEHSEKCYEKITTEPELKLDCTYDNLDAYVHSSECKDELGNLICSSADHVIHEHTDMCYDADENLVCELTEVKAHKHTEDCYQIQEEEVEHVHDDSCYEMEVGEIICGLEESEEHAHVDECYEQIETVVCGMEEGDVEETVASEPVLVCDKTEKVPHEHTDGCYDASSGEKVLTCEKLEMVQHTHTEDCMKAVEGSIETIEKLICKEEEHRHDETCLPEETDENEPAENQSETDEESVSETDDSMSGEGGSTPSDSTDAWAEVTGKATVPKMRLFALNNQSREVEEPAPIAESGPLDMTEWINDVTMYKHENGTVTEIQNGTTVYEGDLIQFKLDYTIEGQVLAQMQEGEPDKIISKIVTYHIPDTFKTVNGDSGNIYNSDDEIVGTFTIDSTGNNIILTYDDLFVEENGRGKQIKGYISFFSVVEKITENTEEDQFHDFNSKIEVNLDVRENQNVTGDLSVTKTKMSVEGNVIKYMLNVTSAEGTGGPVTLTDVMSTGLTYIKNTVSVTKNGSSVDYTVKENGNSLELILPEMGAEDRYIITYSAEADIDLLDAELDVTNTATVTSKDSHDNPLENSATVTHNFNILDKKGEPGENGKIDWTITINRAKLDISGWKLTDVLNGVEFKGPVSIYNSHNELVQANVMLPYTFPRGSTDMYYITYTTEHSLVDGTNVTNEARFEKDGITVTDQDGTSVGTPLEKKGQIDGDVEEDEDGTNWVPIKWTVTVDTSAGPIPAGNSLVDKLLPDETGLQEGYMTYEQLIAAYYSVNDALKEALDTHRDILSLSESKATVYKTGESYTLAQLLSNYNGSQSYNFEKFEFVLAEDIPKGELITFTYISSGIFYNNTVNNSTFANRFSISNHYEVKAKVSYSTADLTAGKRGILYFNPNINYGSQDWKSDYQENMNLSYEHLIDNYLAWIIEVDTPPGYTGSGDVTLYEDMPEGVTLKRFDISEKDGERWILDDVKYGKTSVMGENPHGSYTVTVTEEGDLEIIIPEELIAYHSEWADAIPEGTAQTREHHTLFIVYTQMTDLKWPHVNENSMISKKAFENKFTLVNSDGDTITFGKCTQNITRDDSKGHVIKGYSTDQNYITYQVLLNPEGRDFDPTSNTLDVNDTLVYTSTEEKPLELELVARSVKLYEYEGKDGKTIVKGDPVDFSYIYDEEFVTDGNGVTTKTHTIDLVIPDGKPLVLEYRYRATGSNEQHSLVNTCTIDSVGQGSLDGESRVEMNVINSTAGADTAGVTIYKIDAENHGVYLPNAKFKLYIWNKFQNEYISVTDPSGNPAILTTDAGGKIELDATTINKDYIAYNTAYKLVEIEAPDHYYLLKDPYYFYIANDDLETYKSAIPTNFTGKAIAGNGNVFIPNESSVTKIAVRKKWKDSEGKDITVKGDQVKEVQFELWRKTKGVANSDVSCGTYTITPDENGYWEKVITNLPKGHFGEDGKTAYTYIYYIKEVSVRNFEVIEYEYDDNDPVTKDDSDGIQTGTITMTNQATEGYELPETGGIGTTPYTMGGLLLMIAAAAFFLSYRNRKHGKEDFTSS